VTFPPPDGKGRIMSMRPELVALFNRLNKTESFERGSFDDVNATNIDNENALHWAARRNDVEAARLLIEAGINIDQHGDLGLTPLHEAASLGHRDMVLLLIESGADVHALMIGDTPSGLARIRGHTEICDLLRTAMKQEQQEDPHVGTKIQIDLLRREIVRLEKLLT
jgi:ankyrin repeat protein